ncbi:MAG: SigE family RNA polymerase sigma factor [Hamadaea sp.]|uniref:SigE family RNA polymerase sigma factor n=1 Tax=Hamadaea sp. TaxID=2024425 RepID=UPI0018428579|nr:SigE family RNA polymerase sigma factor [Hamadaea sp.]NUR70573.1 SigE family RNA polymerase sigma factor [Hamadaea sp.]NUT19298.1 SigE family RNA polymerase sigma factor [Hamadaea sp.]
MRDADRFDEFYRGTRVRVLQFLYAACGDLGEAQDAAQEAYTRAWQRWGRVGRSPDPEAWIRVVGWRIVANSWRKQRGRLAAYRRHGLPDPAPAPGENTVALIAALKVLPIDQRIAVVLHHILDLPVAAIAVETGVPVGTVKARLARGRRTLGTLIDMTEANHV